MSDDERDPTKKKGPAWDAMQPDLDAYGAKPATRALIARAYEAGRRDALEDVARDFAINPFAYVVKK